MIFITNVINNSKNWHATLRFCMSPLFYYEPNDFYLPPLVSVFYYQKQQQLKKPKTTALLLLRTIYQRSQRNWMQQNTPSYLQILWVLDFCRSKWCQCPRKGHYLFCYHATNWPGARSYSPKEGFQPSSNCQWSLVFYWIQPFPKLSYRPPFWD